MSSWIFADGSQICIAAAVEATTVTQLAMQGVSRPSVHFAGSHLAKETVIASSTADLPACLRQGHGRQLHGCRYEVAWCKHAQEPVDLPSSRTCDNGVFDLR